MNILKPGNKMRVLERLTGTGTGPIVRLAPNEYSIHDPAAVKEIYGLGSSTIKVLFPQHLQ